MNRRSFLSAFLAAPFAPVRELLRPRSLGVKLYPIQVREKFMPFEVDANGGFWIHPKVSGLRDLERLQTLERENPWI